MTAWPLTRADQQQRRRRAIAEMARDQLAVADRLGRWLLAQRRAAGLPPFAARFASLHDLAAEHVWPELQRQQDRLTAALDHALRGLRGSGLAETIVQEALQIAQAHRDQLADRDTLPRRDQD